MSNELKHLIFSNKEFKENCSEECQQDYCDCEEITYEDELLNLDVEVDGRILAIADVGRWNGRFSGYKILGNKIKDILQSECDFVRWYSDGKEVRGELTHHDGTHYVEYRVVKEEHDIEGLLEKIYNNEEISRKTIGYYTKSLHPYIKDIYGW